MLLNLQAFAEYADRIANDSTIEAVGFDFETNGLKVYEGAKAFIMGFAFNDVKHCVRTDTDEIKPILCKFFSNKKIHYLAHNASFELSFLKHQFGIEPEDIGPVWDTEVFERIADNGHRSYSLENAARRRKSWKYVPMMEWLAADKNRRHHMAPETLIVPYVEQDAWLSLYLYRHQRDTFSAWDKSPVPVSRLVDLELRTVKNLFRMQDTGLHVDVAYCLEAKRFEEQRANNAKESFRAQTGVEFVSSAKCLSPVFKALGLPCLKTEKGNDSFNDDTLELSKGHPVIDAIRTIRNAEKRVSTYWNNFIDLQIGGIIYPNFRQSGTVTGRYSCWDPNVQNWPDDSENETPFPVRRAFVAPEGFQILSIDYKQMEYRFLMDISKDLQGIDDILRGADPHQRAADAVGVTRSKAKNAVFAKIYGAGNKRLAQMLGISLQKASALAQAIERNAPTASEYCRRLISDAESFGWGYNLKGRRYIFAPAQSYCYPDYKIQGGCSDILRIAQDGVMQYLRENASGKSRLISVIHDELVFQIANEDLVHIPALKKIMCEAYKPWRLPLAVSTAIGPNFHDLKEVA